MADKENEKFKQRLVEIQNRFSKSVSDFARQLDMNQQTVANYLLGKRDVSLDVVWRVAMQFPEVSSHWLLTGEGPMSAKSATEESTKAAAGGAIANGVNEHLMEENKRLAAQVEALQAQNIKLMDSYQEMTKRCIEAIQR